MYCCIVSSREYILWKYQEIFYFDFVIVMLLQDV